MLCYLKIRNYKSVLETKLDLKFSEGKAPNGYREMDYLPFLEEKQVRCVPALAIFGSNGSGKSNLIRAISILQTITTDGADICNKYIPNKLNDMYKATDFELEFVTGKNTYNYILSYDEKEIVEEVLRKNNRLLFSVRDQDVSAELLSNDELERVKQTFLDSCLDQNIFKKPLILMIKRWLSGVSQDISKVFDYLRQDIAYFSNNRFPVPMAINLLSSSQRSPEESFRKIIEYLKKMDISVLNAEASFLRSCIKKEEYSDGCKISNWVDQITFFHESISGSKIPLKLSEESDGTQVLLGLLGVFLWALENGKVLFIDELDDSLHPVILKAIVRMFKDKSLNTKNAQLIFSTHDTSVLEDELLRISEAAFVENALNGGTTIKRISDFSGVSNYDNFRRMYVNGQFGATPITIV